MLKKQEGFTLIELLLVVVIIGLMLAVIVPRAWRANIDAKYGLVRQNCSELASFGVQWAESELAGQNEEGCSATLADYLAYLCGSDGVATASQRWVADSTSPGWQGTPAVLNGRNVGANDDVPPSGTAKSFVPVDKIPRNPFNGLSVFDENGNDPTGASPIPGAIAGGYISDGAGEWYYFAFTFQGTENEGVAFTDMHANMDAETLPGLRSGVFMARANDPTP